MAAATMRVVLVTLLLVATGNAFQLVHELLNWHAAYAHCTGLGSHLAVIRTQADADAIKTLLTDNSIEEVHLGVSDIQFEGRYYTILGDQLASLSFDQWAPGAPIGGNTLNCGSYSAAGLTDDDCAFEKPFICDIRDDYELVEGFGWYKHHTTRANWANARQVCEQEGSHLLILNSEEELSSLHAKYNYIWVWVGVHNVYANQEFVTLYNEPVGRTGYSRWRSGDPTGDNLSHPVIALESTNGYYTSPAGNTREFICEREVR